MFVPLTVELGIKCINQTQVLEPVLIRFQLIVRAYKNPNLISEIAKLHGSQCVVISIDAKLKK